jgi:hypothetical protein
MNKRMKEALPEEVAIYGFIADQIAPYIPKGATVTIGSRTYSVAKIFAPWGSEKRIVVKGAEVKPQRQVISWLMLVSKLHLGRNIGYRGHVADLKEFLFFAEHLPEIAHGLKVNKAELYRRYPVLEKYLEPGGWSPKNRGWASSNLPS